MRAKVIIPAAGLAVLVLLLAFHHRFAPPASAPTPPPEAAAPPEAPAPAGQPAQPRRPSAAASHDSDEIPAADTPAVSADEVELDPVSAQVAQLNNLGANDDPASLRKILSQLNNQSPQVRKAAVDAAVQFGSQDALPALRNQLSWTDDPHEKIAIQNAIDFLQLPSVDSLKTDAPGASSDAPQMN